MQGVIDDIRGRRWRRPAILGGATLLTFALVLGLARLAAAPTLEMMFARLEPDAAARILQELESRGVAHELRGDSIWVDGARRDRLRLDLAAEGLPGADGAGYEILDDLSGFGTTTQMFDAALARAREGELARTLLAGRGVDAARVHVAAPTRSPFARDGGGAKAAVTLRMRSGAVPADLAEAAQSLVAGAIPGLAPEAVSVVDARTGRVVSRDGAGRAGADRDARLAAMRASVDRLLEARVGPGRFVAEIALETSTAEERMRERVLDPAGRVALTTETTETSASGTEGAGEGVTVASNLPDGDAAAGGGGQSASAETREVVAYDVSSREREVTRAPGAVERISVAVMVDGLRGTDAAGQETWTPRAPEDLEAIAALVQSAVGFQEARGDVVTVRSLRFEEAGGAMLDAAPAPFLTGAQAVRAATVLALAAAVAAILAFVVRPLLGARAAAPVPIAPAEGEAPALPSAGGAAAPALPGPDAMGAGPDAAGAGGLPALGDLPALEDLPMVGDGGGALASAADDGDPVERLRALIAERRDETVDVLRAWIEDAPAHEEAR